MIHKTEIIGQVNAIELPYNLFFEHLKKKEKRRKKFANYKTKH